MQVVKSRMRYNIAYDKKGRLRVRFGVKKFTEEEGYGICNLLLKIDGVEEVFSTPVNGGVLITYHGDIKSELFSVLDSLQRKNLPADKPTPTQSIAVMNQKFQNKFVSMIVTKNVAKYLLPMPLKWMVTIVRATKFIRRGLRSLWRGSIDVDVLDGAAITASLLYQSPKTASSIMFLLTISDLLSDYTKFRVNHILTQSLAINVDTVWLVTEDGDCNVCTKSLKVSDCIRIQTGNMIPIDGSVVSGEASVNESAMTGEPLPTLKRAGNIVFAGTVLEHGSIVVKVSSIMEETRIAKILEMINDSELNKASMQSKMEHFADKIVPLNFLLFAGIYLVTRNIHKALSVLMVDYSCALKLTTPIAIICAMKEAAEHDVLIKGGKYLENFANADTVVFDKTGTLTSASPKVASILTVCDLCEDEILRIAACIEEHFPHSVANAIVKEAKDRNLLHAEDHAEVEYIVAHGISTQLDGEKTIIGSFHFVFEDENILYDEKLHQELDSKIGHYSPIYLAKNNQLIGVICIDDPPREEAYDVIAGLHNRGIKNIIMITGDSEKTAKAVSQKLGIDDYFAGVLPQEKAEKIRELKAKGQKVIMLGDGVNDAPALAEASVSVALNDASDIAKEVSDITILNGDLEELLYIRDLSSALLARIKNNYKMIMGFNTGLLLGGLLGQINPIVSSFLHNSSTLVFSANSTRSLKKRGKIKVVVIK